jgi:hypothetical protein
MLTAQQQMIRQCRAQLETWLEEHGDSSDGGAPSSPGRGMSR